MIIEAFGEKKEFKNYETVLNILKEFKPYEYKNYMCAVVNNKLFELTFVVKGDSKIEFLDLKNSDACFVYQASLRYLFSYALHELFPDSKVIYNYSISRSLFAQPVGIKHPVDFDLIRMIENKMNELIAKDLVINRVVLSHEKAKKIYEAEGLKTKHDLIDYRESDNVNSYELNGYYNYMHNYLVPSTGFIDKFKLNLYTPGIIIQYPRAELNGEIPRFVNETVLGKYLKDANKWGNITGAAYISEFNKIVENGDSGELINLCETKHNNLLAELGKNIFQDIENIKLICVAGPSSSGKTTFTNRLRIELTSLGIKPLMISLDNYYKTSGNYPLDEDGKPDYEHIEALDIDLFNEQIFKLIEGEEVSLPIFNFKTHEREFGSPIRLEKNQPIMIEGIHALNDDLSRSIPADNKYRIYIAPQSQLHIDAETPISMTDVRLLRRLVRDFRDRNSDPRKTIEMWPSVRRGEFRWIYPYQEQADFVFNSELSYELGVLKEPAMKVLSKVSKDYKEYFVAHRLLNILKYIKPIDPKWVPCNSILREFIGGSIFYEK
ncbi:MAG: hypothetical protein K6G48_00500 [Acholeplasmatales bacterium]|nr:hypothetical protein [Acholeplasmatales bacterium]